MKRLKFIIGLAIAAISMTSCNSNEFKVKGVVEGIDDGDTLLIYPFAPESSDPLDTLVVSDGEFEWKGDVDSVFLCTVVAPKTRTYAMFFREAGTIKMLLSASGESQISGTEANDALQEMNKVFFESQKKAETLMEKINAGGLDQEQQVEIYTQLNELQKEVGVKMKEMTMNNLNNEFGYFFLTQLAYGDQFSRDELIDALSKLPEAYKERQAIKDIQKKINDTFPTEIGQKIPNFKLHSTEGQEVGIMDLVKQNQITLLDFWASWCMPCREGMPAMKKLLADYQEKGFGIIGLSIDDDKDAWIKSIEELELTWPQTVAISGTTYVQRSFNIQFIPYTVVLDKEGTILAKGMNHEELQKFISEKLQ